MKLLSVVGARPQFIKLFPVSRALRRCHDEIVVNTGQHYDFTMAGVFWGEMNIPKPDYDLGIGSGSHAAQTAGMLVGLEDVILKERPDAVLIFGDTNSTLAAALAASKLRVPIAHVEAGLRSFSRDMPEEVNRVVADHLSHWLFCPTETAVQNLHKEGIVDRVFRVGDVMLDAALYFGALPETDAPVVLRRGLEPGKYLLATIHRASNTDSPDALHALFRTFGSLDERIIFPVHPRTRKAMAAAGITPSPNVQTIDPVGYLEMLALEKQARMILTDSGGVQKEAFFFGVPCLTLRTETEWTELVEAGWNRVVGLETDAIVDAVRRWKPPTVRPELYGKGDAANRIAELLS